MFNKILAVVEEQAGKPCNRDTRFYEDLEFDSIDMVEMVMALEDEFHVAITDDEAPELTTVGKAADMVMTKLGVLA